MASRKTLLSERLRIDESLREIHVLRGNLGKISFYRWIRDMRKKLHMSQKQLAKRAKMTQPQLSQIESGKAKITMVSLEKIFAALFCEVMILPLAFDDLESVVKKQAKLAAEKKLGSLMGSMVLEEQLPASKYLEKKIEEVADDLIHSGTTKIWDV